MANVYVFNMLGETIQSFAPNGFTAGQVARWSGPDTDAPFTPAQLVVPLVDAEKNPSLKYGRFQYGDNDVLFRTGSVFKFSVSIDKPKKSKNEQDLLLYVGLGKWLLYKTQGKEMGEIVDQGKIEAEQADITSDDQEAA